MGLNRYTIFPPAPAGFPLALAAPTAPTAAPAATIPAGSSISGSQLPLPLPQTEFTHPSNAELGLPAFAAVPYRQYALGNAPAAAAATEEPVCRFEISAPAEGAAIEAMHSAFTASSAVQERASQERQRMHPQRNVCSLGTMTSE
jgi:hypothetical protein